MAAACSWDGTIRKSHRRERRKALLKRFAEGWPPFERLGPGVDALAGAAIVPRPAIDQAPTGAARFSALEFRSENEVLIGRRYIEVRLIAGRRVTLIFDAEGASDLPAFIPRQCEPSAHRFDVAESETAGSRDFVMQIILPLARRLESISRYPPSARPSYREESG